jgi:hypothetical protein
MEIVLAIPAPLPACIGESPFCRNGALFVERKGMKPILSPASAVCSNKQDDLTQFFRTPPP